MADGPLTDCRPLRDGKNRKRPAPCRISVPREGAIALPVVAKRRCCSLLCDAGTPAGPSGPKRIFLSCNESRHKNLPRSWERRDQCAIGESYSADFRTWQRSELAREQAIRVRTWHLYVQQAQHSCAARWARSAIAIADGSIAARPIFATACRSRSIRHDDSWDEEAVYRSLTIGLTSTADLGHGGVANAGRCDENRMPGTARAGVDRGQDRQAANRDFQAPALRLANAAAFKWVSGRVTLHGTGLGPKS